MAFVDSTFAQTDVWGKRAVQYPSPYFDLAQTYLPPNVKEMFKWCRYYYFKHPLVSPVVNKLAEFPIMDLVYTTGDKKQQDWWKELLEEIMNFRRFAIGIGLDYYTYGNAFASINVPIIKRLVCPTCNHEMPVSKVKWKWRKFAFHGTCSKCEFSGQLDVREIKSKNRYDYNFVRWDPSNIDIEYNPITGKSVYYYQMPHKTMREIIMGKKHVVETIPQYFIEAVRDEKRIKFNTQNFFHFKRETLAERDQEWGKSIIFPVLSTIFYMQTLNRSQEAIAVQHIVPLWVLFPQATPTMDPYTTMNLDTWRRKVEEELLKWKRDPNYIPVMPMPIGNAIIGGEGRGLLLGQEIQMLCQNILAGLGVPQEFIYGGLSYTGTSVTLRMLENHLIGHVSGIQKMLKRFVIPFLAKCLDREPIEIKMGNFRMADDIQRKQIIMQLNQGNKISNRTMLSEIEPTLSYEEELKTKNTELVDEMNYARKQNTMNAEIQGLVQIVSAGYQAEANQISQQKQMQGQAEMLLDLQTRAQNGDQLAQMQLQQMMGPAPGDPNAQGGDPNAQGQPQGQPAEGQEGGAPDPNMIVQLALMPPEELQRAVQAGQVDPQMAEFAQQMAQLAQQTTQEQLQGAVQAGQIDEQSAQIITAIQQQMGSGQQTAGQPILGSQSQMEMDAFRAANPGLDSAQYASLVIGYAKQLDRLPVEIRKSLIGNMRQQSPELYQSVIGTYDNIKNMQAKGMSKSQIDQALTPTPAAQ